MTDASDNPDVEESEGLERAEGLYQDIVTRLLAEVERFPEIPYNDWPKIERSRLRMRIKGVAQQIVYDAIRIVHDEGAPSIDAVVKGVNIKKDGLALSLIAPQGQKDRHVIADAVGREVCVVISDAAKYFNPEDGEGEPEASEGDESQQQEKEGKCDENDDQ